EQKRVGESHGPSEWLMVLKPPNARSSPATAINSAAPQARLQAAGVRCSATLARWEARYPVAGPELSRDLGLTPLPELVNAQLRHVATYEDLNLMSHRSDNIIRKGREWQVFDSAERALVSTNRAEDRAWMNVIVASAWTISSPLRIHRQLSKT